MTQNLNSSVACRTAPSQRQDTETLFDARTAATVTPSGAADDTYDVVVEITLDGGRGEGKFKVSTDGGATFGAEQTIDADDGEYTIPSTGGIVITFADDTFTDGDLYSFSSTPADPVTDPATFGTVQVEFLSDVVSEMSLKKELHVFGTFTADIALEGSLDGTHYVSLGSLSDAAGKIATSEPWLYLRAHVTGYETGDITAILAY